MSHPFSEPLKDRERQLLRVLPRLAQQLEQSLAPDLKARLPVDDLVQDTFVKAWQCLDEVRSESDIVLLSWLRRIAHRTAIDHIRLKSGTYFRMTLDPAAIESFASSSWLTASQQFSREELRSIAAWAMRQLGALHQAVLHQRYVEGKTFVEIGDCLGQSSAAVRGLHRTAAHQLRSLLGRASMYLSAG